MRDSYISVLTLLNPNYKELQVKVTTHWESALCSELVSKLQNAMLSTLVSDTFPGYIHVITCSV